MIPLKPCPFCAREPRIVETPNKGDHGWWLKVRCDGCDTFHGSVMALLGDPESFTSAKKRLACSWNRRLWGEEQDYAAERLAERERQTAVVWRLQPKEQP